jgi:dolichyl-phosphate-mannose-protein mannosyltransferase
MIMGRVTYLHHCKRGPNYVSVGLGLVDICCFLDFPALYFSILMAAFVYDHIGSIFGNHFKTILLSAVWVAVTLTFYYFAPLAYGFSEPSTTYSDRRWLSSWNIAD